jgi:hypothetical protein
MVSFNTPTNNNYNININNVYSIISVVIPSFIALHS